MLDMREDNRLTSVVLRADQSIAKKKKKKKKKPCSKRTTVVFFCVGDYTCPLAAHVPTLSMGDGYYVFPLPGRFYGVQVPHSTPADVVERFEAVLAECSLFRRKGPTAIPAAPKAAAAPGKPAKAGGKAAADASAAAAGPAGAAATTTLARPSPYPSVPAAQRIEKAGTHLSRGIETSGKVIAGGLATGANHLNR
jgi:hypothetical protein